MSATKVKFRSGDGKIYLVDLETAKVFGTIKTMIDELGIDDKEPTLVPIGLNSDTLQKAIVWAEYHKNHPPVWQEEMLTTSVSNWYLDFFDVDKRMMVELIWAADYLEIEKLREIASKLVNLVMDKTPD